MTTREIRTQFLEYFAARDHLVVPSASLIPFEDDPSVLLTIAGMQPLKSYFMGTATPPARRMASSQKCFRTLDIDQVGRTARHLTFFEMLGNFSIGDYFKDDAIRFGFEFSTDVLGLDPAQIWITVFEGMPGVPADDEAVARWMELGIPKERIQALGEADNFWKAGPTGPCGPNTELYLDRGPAFGPEGGPVVGGDRYLEFWNLVFMQYERGADGSLEPLPAKNIDTGAGLERIAALLQGKHSVFETDAFRPLIAWGEEASGRAYGTRARDDRSLRVLADHGRAMTFLANDGVRPGNEGRDYVLRRIIRRAVSEGGQIGLAPEFVAGLADAVVAGWSDVYPDLQTRRDDIVVTLTDEAEQFARTLAQGKRLLARVIDESGSGAISGVDAFRLFDTYGFPLDLTVDAAEEASLSVDVAAFDALMSEQRERARTAARRDSDGVRADVDALVSASSPSRFVGYDHLSVETTVVAVRALGEGEYLLKLEASPFYAKGGGQISDIGRVTAAAGAGAVTDVYRAGEDQALRVRWDGTAPTEGLSVTASVDRAARGAIEANHTGTHLLNWALRTTLGEGVRQAGSYVGADKLRFDFTHRDRISAEARAAIEMLVLSRIEDDVPVTIASMARDAADSSGAIGLFEEKYGAVVRVVDAGPGSRELCGGTHVASTGRVGAFKIVAEQGTGAGTRRIEALTGAGVVAWYREREAELLALVEARDERVSALEAQLKSTRTSTAVSVSDVAAGATRIDGVDVVAAEVSVGDMDELLALSDRIKGTVGPGAVVVLAARADGKAMLGVNVGSDASARGVSANAIVRAIARHVDGAGGGREGVARAGGKNPDGIPVALEAVGAAVRSAMNGSPA